MSADNIDPLAWLAEVLASAHRRRSLVTRSFVVMRNTSMTASIIPVGAAAA